MEKGSASTVSPASFILLFHPYSLLNKSHVKSRETRQINHMRNHRKTMAKKLSRSEWYNTEARRKKWIDTIETPNGTCPALHIESLSEIEFKKLKQRWNSYKHRSKKRSISLEITPKTHQLLKKLQKNRTLTATIESLINQTFNQLNQTTSITQIYHPIEINKNLEQQKDYELSLIKAKIEQLTNEIINLREEIKNSSYTHQAPPANNGIKPDNSDPHKKALPKLDPDINLLDGRTKW